MTLAGRRRRLGRLVAIGLSPVLATALVGSVTTAVVARETSRGSKPNIVVIYMDDFSPNAPELWSDPERTPTLARFVEEGTWFSTTSGSTPRCGPARGNLLTGRWSHNNGVTDNDIGPYQPRMSVASKLGDRGYHTIFAGKYFNVFRRTAPTYDSVERYADNWDQFDAQWNAHGSFYQYPLWTKDGVERYGSDPNDHSTFVVTKRVQEHIRNAPDDEPVFAVASLYAGHDPNQPMPRFEGAEACQGESWWGPAYNEADVSDKPSRVQQRPLVDEEAYDLEARCEEILSVDWAAGKIMQTLEETGRLDDTAFIFTADNGWMMNEHRIDTKKVPYSTPVPMYVLWPEQWAGAPREIDEPVSSVDLAPTFCALADCSIKHADGLSLLPLLDGETDRLERTFVYEESLHERGVSTAWYGLRTTKGYDPEARWVYTELHTDERELYDLVADPHQLENLAGLEGYAEIEADLRDLLHREVIEPNDVQYVDPPPSE